MWRQPESNHLRLAPLPIGHALREDSQLLLAETGAPAKVFGEEFRQVCDELVRSLRSAQSGHSSSAAYSADRLLLLAAYFRQR